MSEATDLARATLERLLGLGVTEAVLSPGSRSGPLALALHAADAQGLLRLHVRIDEREAGFLALGLAKASAQPVPAITTSGTAVVNLHPAMLEALHTGARVIAVTADRPGRLRGTGASQTTDQREIFPRVIYAETPADITAVAAPQHLNLEFDEPLIEPTAWRFSPDVPAPDGFVDDLPAIELDAATPTIVIAGDGAGPQAAACADRGGWPLLAEPSSLVRGAPGALGSYRYLLDGHRLAGRIRRIVSFGHATLSRAVTRALTRGDIEVVHVGTAASFPGPLAAHVTVTGRVIIDGEPDPEWLPAWRYADEAACNAIDLLALDTHRIAETIWHHSEGKTLVIGSSSIVRDIDLVARSGAAPDLVVANRGLAGIDGMISTAIGVSLAVETPTVAVMGDLTFLHGSNGLLLGPGEPRPSELTIVVVNDDGGAIFSGLEQGADDYADAFERTYATPTGADLGALCRAYGVPHRLVAADGLTAALAGPDSVPGISVIEVRVDRGSRRADAARIADVVAATF